MQRMMALVGGGRGERDEGNAGACKRRGPTPNML